MMKKFADAFAEKLEQTIAAIEEKTSAEIVVVIAPAGDAYADTCYKGGALLSFITLIYLLFAPLYYAEIFVPLIIALAFVLGAFIVRFFPPVKALLVSTRRKQQQVDRAAYTYFMEKDLSDTMDRTACLFYFSLLEKKCKLIPDKGLESAVPQGQWLELEARFHELFQQKLPLPQAILEALPGLIPVLSVYLPPAADNIDELSNRLGMA